MDVHEFRAFEAMLLGDDLPSLEELTDPAPFALDAACRETPNVRFFVERGENTEPAKQVCRRCLVREECLSYALDNGIRHGIWGGCSERERRRLRGQRAA